MGCSHSSLNRIDTGYIFNSKDVLYLTQSWNIIKIHDLQKFAQNVLIRMINQNSSLRQYWRSKIEVDGNNYDYNQNDSCLRTDLSWHIGLRDYSIQFISIFDRILSVINDENRFQLQIRSLSILENIFLIENVSLSIFKQCIMEILRERFKLFNYNFTDDYENVWNKFLTFIIEYMIQHKASTQIIIPSTINNEQS